MSKYRIVKNTFVDAYGMEYTPYYTIQERKKFLWINYWQFVTHHSGWASRPIRTKFHSYKTAEEFAEQYICKNNIRDGVKEEIMLNNDNNG